MTTPQDELTQGQGGDRLVDVVVVGGSQSGLAMAWQAVTSTVWTMSCCSDRGIFR